MNLKKNSNLGKYLKILTFLLSISSKVFSIESGDSVQRNINALMYLGVIDMQFSYYQLDGESAYIENHYTYQPLLNKQHVLNFEIGVVKSFQQEGSFITPSDFKLAYQYNLHKILLQQLVTWGLLLGLGLFCQQVIATI